MVMLSMKRKGTFSEIERARKRERDSRKQICLIMLCRLTVTTQEE